MACCPYVQVYLLKFIISLQGFTFNSRLSSGESLFIPWAYQQVAPLFVRHSARYQTIGPSRSSGGLRNEPNCRKRWWAQELAGWTASCRLRSGSHAGGKNRGSPNSPQRSTRVVGARRDNCSRVTIVPAHCPCSGDE